MLANRGHRVRVGAILALLVGASIVPGCESIPRRKPELTPPVIAAAPYGASQGEVLWAVLPLMNESGTELFDPLTVSDELVAAAEEVQGVRTVPLNRTLQAMHALGIRSIQGPGDVHRLAAAMGVDGVLLGSVTAYDPYDPPTLGLSLALYARTPAMGAGGAPAAIDPRALAEAPTDTTPNAAQWLGEGPTAVISAHLDARDHGVLTALKAYAEGRHDPESALGWRRYTASMDLYTQFATQHLVAGLLQDEQTRLAALAGQNETPAP
jgi:hypothetical protein